jgi:hypothetical protein
MARIEVGNPVGGSHLPNFTAAILLVASQLEFVCVFGVCVI